MSVTTGGLLQKMKKQWCRHVIGKIANHPQPLPGRRQLPEVEAQGVTGVDPQSFIARILCLQLSRQIPIQLDDIEAAAGLQQGAGESPETGADFHYPLAGFRADGAHDARDYGGVVEEVLAEALARSMSMHGY